MRALVAGWFSWELYGATAGDLMACKVACDWLQDAGLPFDVALAPPLRGGVDWREVDPARYTHLVFVCGPFRNIGPAITDFLDRFAHCWKAGLDLSMIAPVTEWNPFDLLLERDSDRTARPDISLACRQPKVPVVGICLVHPQKEYGKKGRHAEVGDAVRGLLDARELAAVTIDTRLDKNGTGLRTPREVESLLAGVEVVVTTRLHGTVLALKNGVPAVVIDPIAGGAKVRRQAGVLGWPVAFTAGELDDAKLREAFDYCLTDEARALASACARRGANIIEEQVHGPLIAALADSLSTIRQRNSPGPRALVAGWFSWEAYGATAGDLMARDVACGWLAEARLPYDVALAPPFRGGVDWREVDPSQYTHLVFVCGPFGNGEPLTEFLPRFAHCYKVGLDVSMLGPVAEWNPFDLLLERDSDCTARPDISLACRQPRVPVVGVCLVHKQKEYGDRGRHRDADDAVRQLLDDLEAAAVRIDTRLDENATSLRTPREVESLIARMDVLLTTRLHGTVLALKNGVPALAVDPISGGAKIKRQAETLGWPVVFTADGLDVAEVREAFDYCLTDEARARARECGDEGRQQVAAVRDEFLTAVARTLRPAGEG